METAGKADVLRAAIKVEKVNVAYYDELMAYAVQYNVPGTYAYAKSRRDLAHAKYVSLSMELLDVMAEKATANWLGKIDDPDKWLRELRGHED